MIKDFNTKSLSRQDVMNLALQRTSSLLKFPLLGRASYTLWSKGIDVPLALEASFRRSAILSSAWASTRNEYDEIKLALSGLNIGLAVDIGCGLALIDILLMRDFGCAIDLVDIEESNNRHHSFRDEGAGYTSLDSASKLLSSNVTNAGAIRSCNPTHQPLPLGDADLIISLLSCGFHYPLSTYEDYMFERLTPGGVLIVDLRDPASANRYSERFTSWKVIRKTDKYSRVMGVR
jgi:hypothetical protein